MNKVLINQGRVLESGYRYMISLLLVCGMVVSIVAINNLIGFILMIALSSLLIMLWTTFYMLEIDIKNQTYLEFTAVLGYKFGTIHSFDGIEKIFIDAEVYSQKIYGYGPNAHEMKSYEFKAYLRFSNGEKLFLVSDEDEKELIERLQSTVRKLKTQITSPSITRFR